MAESGARLVEVGTTNRTYLPDYEAAIGDNTAALLRVHTSNFRMVGFTESPSSGRPRPAGPRAQAPAPRRPRQRLPAGHDAVRPRQGADAAGKPGRGRGPRLLLRRQAARRTAGGLIVGRADLVDRLKRHPIARAARLDKGAIAALATTLGHYVKNEALEKVPVWRMIAMPVAEIEGRANELGVGSWARAPASSTDGRWSAAAACRRRACRRSCWPSARARRHVAGPPPAPGRAARRRARRARHAAPRPAHGRSCRRCDPASRSAGRSE